MESTTATVPAEPASQPGPSAPFTTRFPPVTSLAVIACAVLFVVNAKRFGQLAPAADQIFGFLPSQGVWDGGYWSLFSSAFVHLEVWHVAFNVYWLWILGRLAEREMGSLPYTLFLVGAAFVSSSIQLAVGGDTGIGASGIVYALFGLIWSGRRSVPAFAEGLSKRTAQLFWIWL